MKGPGGAIADNNDFGLALVMTVPLLAYLARDEKGPLLRTLLVVMSAACVAGVLFTRSRGGLVALGAMGLVWLWMLRRNAWAFMLAPLGLALTLILSPPELWTRIRAVVAGAADPSAEGRIVAWQKGLHMWAESASTRLFGVGPGNFTDPALWARTEPVQSGVQPIVAHNTYIQILAENGAVTLLVFLALMVVTLVALVRTPRDGA